MPAEVEQPKLPTQDDHDQKLKADFIKYQIANNELGKS